MALRTNMLACLLLGLFVSSQAAGVAGLRQLPTRGRQRPDASLRLRGGGMFGREKVKSDDAVLASKDENESWVMRSVSHSVLDNSTVQEPGLGDALANHSTSTAVPKPGAKVSASESAEFAKKAKDQATTRDALNEGTECRVQAALQALGENAESYEDFKRYNVVLVASEHASYAKTGGLADVVDKLSLALALRGHRVMTVIPMYGDYEGAMPTGIHRGFGLFGGGHTVQYFHKWVPLGTDRWGNETGVDNVFVDHPCFRRPGMYGEWGKDYEDNLMRFGLFSWAAIEAPLCVPGAVPFGDDVIYVANDWQVCIQPPVTLELVELAADM